MPRLLSPKPRLRHGRRHAYLSLLNLYSFLRSVAGSSSSSSSSSPAFSNYFSPREFASVFADYLRSHFSVFQPKVSLTDPVVTCASSAGPHALKTLVPLSAAPSPPLNFLRLQQTTLRPLPLVQTKLPIPC